MSRIHLNMLNKSFVTADYTVHALQEACLDVEEGQSVAIVGPSGSGKSTLINILGLVFRPDSGTVEIDGERVDGLKDTPCCKFRNSNFGYIVQDFALIDNESVYNNIKIPLIYNKSIPRKEHRARIRAAAESLGILDKLHRKAAQLSGGERQRVAIARAIVCEQPIILADEPTGSLDAENRDKVMDILINLCKEKGRTLVLVTHDMSVAERCDRIIGMHDGRIISDTTAA